MPAELNYEDLGLRVVIEVHQQLDTRHKLFCRCPTILRDKEESCMRFSRFLRATKSELGEEDAAAREEMARSRKFIYRFYDSTCLVEADEEPPAELNREALMTALEIALLLNMNIVQEVHTMRKIVVDGSNTTGFQRTALVAMDGYLEVDNTRIGINTLCLEEEAAQKVGEMEGEIEYSLDRLGIPLVEIGTAPDIKTPEQARNVAEIIGMILRSTYKIKRGLGTIRQDVNVSIREGARVEIKGVQELELLDKIIENEVMRQVNLLRIRDRLRDRNAEVVREIFDVTDIFSDTKSKILRKSLKKGKILAILLRGFAGFVGEEIIPGRRLGTEFADIARMFGLGGVFHTDELPAYGITETEIKMLREKLDANKDDCIVIAAGDHARVVSTLKRIMERAEYALVGVPEETRRALDDGTTAYLRPLPGAARMYPETDVPPVRITEEMLENIKLPELINDRIDRFMKSYGLNRDLATLIGKSRRHALFEELVKDGHSPSLVIKALEMIPSEIEREGYEIENLVDDHFRMVFKLLKGGKIAKEGIEEILKKLCENPEISPEDIEKELGEVDINELERFIRDLVMDKSAFIEERGRGAFSPLMGLVMKEYRGKIDGKIISDILMREIEKFLK